MVAASQAIKRAFGGLLKPILRAARIERVDDVADRFRRIELAGDALAGMRCAPGDKLQVMIDGGFRTYTPFAFDRATGHVSLLAFVHGDGPGARWARGAVAGGVVHFFGPRGSVPLRALPSPVVLVGDETSIAVARALDELAGAKAIVLEVGDTTNARTAAEAVGLRDVTLIARAPGDAHMAALWSAVRDAAKTPSALALTGKAQTIQAIRRLAERDRVAFAVQRNKAYWSPGKRGLD